MSTWIYNSGGSAPYAISPYNEAVIAGVTLPATGNALRVEISGLDAKHVSFSAPGTNWSATRRTGLRPRLITWQWQLVASSEADLNTVEAAIEQYIEDGGEYALSDGTRSSAYAVVVPAATRRVGPRKALPDGRYLQRWQLQFRVMWPVVASIAF